ncbi:MAG: pyridoxal phosphate-dependent aminotransferase [Thiolinea sp.]
MRMNRPLQAQPHVTAMASYALADLSIPTGKKRIMLAQNESLRPPAPGIAAAVSSAVTEAQFYPDADWQALRTTIADVHGVNAQQILCGAGSMELIDALMRTYAGPGRRILTTQYAYAFIRTMAQVTQAELDLVDEVDFTVSVDHLLAAVQDETRVVFVANPGNPTGTRIGRAEILRLRAELPESVLLVVDEAYGEFADALNEPVFDLVEQGNTVVLRTFSKAYGLAAMRAGWGLFPPDIAGQIRKLMNPNNISAAGQAVATAAMQDQAYMRETVALTMEIRQRFADDMRSLGLRVPTSYTNFVLVQFSSLAQAQQAEQALRAEGILVRGMGGYGLGDCLRMTIGKAEEMQQVTDILRAMEG